MAIEDTLASAWYGDARPPWWTRPLAALYGGVAACRRRLYGSGLLRSECLPVPVLVVGNLTAGGTGKTPLTLAMVDALRARGWRPGVVSRGHGGSRRGPLLLDEQADPTEVGDEPCLIHAHGVPVAIGRDRPAAARLLLDAGCDVVVADDGLQHYRLARDVEICVVDGMRGFGNGRLLPAGPLREPVSRLRTVDFLVCNGGEREGMWPMHLVGDEAVNLAAARRVPLRDFAGHRVHAVAAIGNPQRFFADLRRQGIEPIEHAFPDHHAFAPEELDFGDGLPVLMTDKDAIKCRRFARAHWWRVPVRAMLPPTFFAAVAARLQAVRGLSRQ